MTCLWNGNYCAENIIVEIPADQINPNTRFFISNTFIHQLKLAINQAKAKQHPDAELLLFDNHSLFSSTLSFKNNRRYHKKCIKDKYICLNEDIC